MAGQVPARLAWVLGIRDDTSLTPRAKHLALTLSTWQDERGVCFPGIETIARAMSVERPTVKRARRELEESGWLRIVTRRGHSNLYLAVFPDGSLMTPQVGHERPGGWVSGDPQNPPPNSLQNPSFQEAA